MSETEPPVPGMNVLAVLPDLAGRHSLVPLLCEAGAVLTCVESWDAAQERLLRAQEPFTGLLLLLNGSSRACADLLRRVRACPQARDLPLALLLAPALNSWEPDAGPAQGSLTVVRLPTDVGVLARALTGLRRPAAPETPTVADIQAPRAHLPGPWGQTGTPSPPPDARSASGARQARTAPLEDASRPERPVILPSLPEVDVEAALSLLAGNRRLYLQLLSHFHQRHAELSRGLEDALKAGDRETVCRLAHTIKGIGGTLGAVGLRGNAAELETALRHGECPPDRMQRLGKVCLDAYLDFAACVARALASVNRK